MPPARMLRMVSLLLGLRLVVAAPSPAAPPPAAARPAPSPRAAVERLHAALVEIMQRADQLGYPGRESYLRDRLPAILDLPFMARKSIGRAWRQLDPDQRKRLVETFSRLSIATYASRFDGYSGERFETLGEEPAALGTVLVHTRLVRPHEDPVQLDYRLRQVEGGWKIIDVFLNGNVSELALRRAEYRSVLRREGFEGLIRELEKKIRLRREKAGS